ncbi:MAG: sigma-70 family RNA polymerase sigma factor [Betaproteobacteria bacterium]|nr:sigma-70 family RNA polymerase sigma factor [Betaproteobacteria bacterium]
MSAPSPGDAELIARVLTRQDRHAYAELVRRNQSNLRALLRRLTHGNLALADDLAQEAFVLAWRKLHLFRGEARFSTWLYRIGYNCFLAHARSAKPEDPLDSDVSESEAAASHAQATELRIDLERALAQLTEPERAAIVQCYYQDLSHEEAAYVLELPLGTLKTHILKAKQKLKAALSSWQPENLA